MSPTDPLTADPRGLSMDDPAFLPDLRELERVARQLCDRLELLVDTAPRDLGAEAAAALPFATTAAAQVLDLLAWLTDPTRPTPEPLQEQASRDGYTELLTRTWGWRPEMAQLEETDRFSEELTCFVNASWNRTEGVSEGDYVFLHLTSGQPLHRDQATRSMEYRTVTLPWEVGAVRRALGSNALSPIQAAILRQVFVEALEKSTALPPITIAPVPPRALGGVADA